MLIDRESRRAVGVARRHPRAAGERRSVHAGSLTTGRVARFATVVPWQSRPPRASRRSSAIAGAAGRRSWSSTTSRRCSPRSRATCAAAFGERYRIVRAGLGRRGARAAARARRARRPGGAARRRPADARDGGHRLPRRGAPARPRRQARPADRLRRHRGGDPGDQRGRARLLPAQAVGPARGAALPGRRGPADHLGVRRGAGGRRRAARRPPLLARTRTTCATSSPATACRRAGSTSSATARRASCSTVAGVADDGLPVALLEDGTVLERPTVLELAERLGVAGAAGVRPLRPGHRRRRAGRAGGGGLRRVGGPAHGDGRARGARRAGRPVEPDRELPRLPGRPQRLGPRAPRDRPGAAARRRAADRAGRRRRSRSRAPGRVVRAVGRLGAQRQLRPRRVGRLLPPARRAGLRRAHRRGRLLRRGDDRGARRARTSTSWSSAARTRPARRPSTSASTPAR